ncbi:MAG: nucleotide exchange factor GrpE [Muribaculaceae bacterium]|nr:nucleotide exchange factor GrpE [Muribaculaceae bacterium]
MGNKNHKNKHGFHNSDENLNSKEAVNSQENLKQTSDATPEIEDIEIIDPEDVIIQENSDNACEDVEKKVEDLNQKLEKEKKEYLFLMAEFDNFRKRTLKEKSEIIKNAGENVLKGLLPIMDDFERGLKAAESSQDSDSLKEGMGLIYNKLKNYLSQNGVKEFDPADDTFDTEKHEAISVVPVPDENKKGKILDTVEKGYMINDKVLRHAKVVVGQ